MKFSRFIALCMVTGLWIACEDPPVASYPQPKAKPIEALNVPDSSFTLQDFNASNPDHQGIRQAICRELKIKDAQLTQSHLARVERLDLFGEEIEKIDPVQSLVGLKRLNIHGNKVVDLSPLKGLLAMEVLEASDNRISDVSALAELTRMKVLHLKKNAISDIAPLEKLTRLISLDLERNQIEEVEVIRGMRELNWLALGANRIRKIESLAGLSHLRHLYLERNRLNGASLQPIKGLAVMRTLSLRGNQVDDISSLTGMKQMSWLELDDNRIVDVSPLADMVIVTEGPNMAALVLKTNSTDRDGIRVAIGKTKRTVIAMRNSKWIHPAGRDVDHPGAQVFIPRILFLNHHHGHGRLTNFSHLCEIRLGATRRSRTLPATTIHGICLGITDPCPKVYVTPLLGTLIPGAVVHTRAGAIRPQRTNLQSGNGTFHFPLSPPGSRGVTPIRSQRTNPKAAPTHATCYIIRPSPRGTGNNIPPQVGRTGNRGTFLVVIGKHHESQAQLFLVVQTVGTQCLALGQGQGRQQKGRQNRYNGDHHQQFDQRKSLGI